MRVFDHDPDRAPSENPQAICSCGRGPAHPSTSGASPDHSRYADDFVMVFADESDARKIHAVLPKRMARFGLTLHPEKTRLLDHRQPPRSGGGTGKPGTFDFLGFTHYWGVSFPKRLWIPKRKTARDRFRRSLAKIKAWMDASRHLSLPYQAQKLALKLRGHDQYYGIIGNSSSLARLRHCVAALWWKALARRSQRGFLSWAAFADILRRHPLAPARVIQARADR